MAGLVEQSGVVMLGHIVLEALSEDNLFEWDDLRSQPCEELREGRSSNCKGSHIIQPRNHKPYFLVSVSISLSLIIWKLQVSCGFAPGGSSAQCVFIPGSRLKEYLLPRHGLILEEGRTRGQARPHNSI